MYSYEDRMKAVELYKRDCSCRCWAIGTSPDAEIVNTMLDGAISSLSDTEHPIVHSEGSHYRWPGWISRMEDAGFIRSMSKKGCTADNSACEGFFGRLKNEMFYYHSWEDSKLIRIFKLNPTKEFTLQYG